MQLETDLRSADPGAGPAVPDPDRAVLRARQVTLGYRSGPVVHAADLALRPAAVTALVGPNGSGKSTLLRALARLHETTTGSITLAARPRTGAGPGATTEVSLLGRRELARRVAVLTQHRPVPDGVTVREVVAFGRTPHRGRWHRSDPEGAAAIEHALHVTGTAGIADRRVDELSGGQLQRVWLAGCLAQRTDVLLLDEPTNHLDLRYQIEMLDLLRDLADAGTAVGVVLHDLQHACEIADHVVVLHEGRVVADGPPRQALTGPLLSEIYGTPVDVHVDDDPDHPAGGTVTVVPRRRSRTR